MDNPDTCALLDARYRTKTNFMLPKSNEWHILDNCIPRFKLTIGKNHVRSLLAHRFPNLENIREKNQYNYRNRDKLWSIQETKDL